MKLLKWRTLCNSYAYTFTSETGKFTRAPLNKMKKYSQLSSVRHISEMLRGKNAEQGKEEKREEEEEKGREKRRKENLLKVNQVLYSQLFSVDNCI